jgi:hypothetical protein
MKFSTLVIMCGLLFIFVENYLDGKSIVCQGGQDQYSRSALEPGQTEPCDYAKYSLCSAFVDQF